MARGHRTQWGRARRSWKDEVSYQFIDASEGAESKEGRRAKGPSMDDKGQFTSAPIKPLADQEGVLGQVDPRTCGTPAKPVRPGVK